MPRHRVVRVAASPDGFTRWTLELMRRLARDGATAPDVEALASRLRTPQAIHEWVRDSITYVADPDPVELVRTPSEVLQLRRGDCDDQVTLACSLARSAGLPAAMVAVDVEGRGFEHVFGLLDGLPSDPIFAAPLGWWPAHRRAMRVEV